jgi:hypothetical protein
MFTPLVDVKKILENKCSLAHKRKKKRNALKVNDRKGALKCFQNFIIRKKAGFRISKKS